ncbi:hypothetical protein DMENIID0001_144550 [Sergentomyia squamirostris]
MNVQLTGNFIGECVNDGVDDEAVGDGRRVVNCCRRWRSVYGEMRMRVSDRHLAKYLVRRCRKLRQHKMKRRSHNVPATSGSVVNNNNCTVNNNLESPVLDNKNVISNRNILCNIKNNSDKTANCDAHAKFKDFSIDFILKSTN